MSKRSYRRLAVVAGAALAVGSMAPAMAAQVNVEGDGTATVDVSEVTVPSAGSLIPSSLIANAQGYALGTVFGAQGLVLNTAGQLQNDVEDIAGDLLGATSDLSVGLDASGNASTGGATLEVSGVANGATDLLGDLPSPSTVVGGVQSNLTPIVNFGLGRATGALALVGQAQSAAGGLLGTGLGLVDGVAVSGDASVVASLLGTL
ncbi:MAG TPA: hypothetical protein VG795_11135 [Acidimicrobiia bacterium]|nr:hypothetical protein [Acidimicrobiia bacterium]